MNSGSLPVISAIAAKGNPQFATGLEYQDLKSATIF